jgi:hypothetical protein
VTKPFLPRRALSAASLLTVALALALCGCGRTAVADGTATLSWTPVTRTQDGKRADIGGYRIYYGRSRSAMSTVVEVPDAQATHYQITHLQAGTWYFAVSAYTVTGQEGPKSDVGSKVIPD